MTTFDTTKRQLSVILQNISDGKLQLPDFQRGWVWDDDHIRSLLVSIMRSFPIGAVMLLETGGEVRFQMRPVEGVKLHGESSALIQELILDGQQRLTSLIQVLKLKQPVLTRDAKRKEVELYYYIDIERAMEGADSFEEAIVAVGKDRMLRSDFGRKVDLDLSSIEREIEAFHFPCQQILDSSEWELMLSEQQQYEKLARFMKFRSRVLEPFRNYQLPVIRLSKETTREAVCLVFEKVNTGGIPLNVFELVTATWATEGFNLRDDWSARSKRLTQHKLLKDVLSTDFLQGISLLESMERRRQSIADKKTGKDIAGVTAKRDHILKLPLQAYTKWAEALTRGFLSAECFLRAEGFYHPKFLPYRTQLVPLAVMMVSLANERWREPRIYTKLSQWFWCGVLGELYGGAVETRIALDVQEVLAWIDDPDAPEPSTVEAANFSPNRLDTLRSRNSAAYRGIYVLLVREGACDFLWKSKISDLEDDGVHLDIHHIFPVKWCDKQGLEGRRYNAIVNKTPISARANRKIGGKAPSVYLASLQAEKGHQLNDAQMDVVLETHQIVPAALRADDFATFYAARKLALLQLIERAMGKSAQATSQAEVEDESDDEDVFIASEEAEEAEALPGA